MAIFLLYCYDPANESSVAGAEARAANMPLVSQLVPSGQGMVVQQANQALPERLSFVVDPDSSSSLLIAVADNPFVSIIILYNS